MPSLNALSIDVEDYFQVSAFESVIGRGDWHKWPARVEANTERLLETFADFDVKATFFTLGWVAENYPGTVRAIVEQGHELGCHGYEHVRLTQHNRDSFRDDLSRSKALLEDVSGERVNGYRAASFSITKNNSWAFDEIESAGFQYSSSVYPVRHDLYGIPDAPRTPFRPDGMQHLIEIPIATARICGRNIPAGGGGYFRLFPYWISRRLLQLATSQELTSANVYFHPWEFDPEQPRPEGLSFKARFRHYLNQGVALRRLKRLLDDFRWAPFKDVYLAEGRA
ncbi:MAG: XrtA system polysaccharide deacetylase [Pseudomonadota bacterium]